MITNIMDGKCGAIAGKRLDSLGPNRQRWKKLCPYLLKTDGNELCHNSGGILFENFYQGCKVYDIVYENEVYPSRYHMNNPNYLWWKFEPLSSSGDVILQNGSTFSRTHSSAEIRRLY